MVDEKIKLIRLMTHKNVLDMLRVLSSGPSRFTDLASACQSERLRSLRLADLMKAGLIQKKAIGSGNDLQIMYQITEKGRKLREEIEGLL
ncbi:MAG: winged helix-turn-helix transcriptional regulator [Candidatus Marsarchaeota archaeon]|nr:winged helix-turn-helix transcriptional regulator [Candidatus Marsarchaeota archaeon]